MLQSEPSHMGVLFNNWSLLIFYRLANLVSSLLWLSQEVSTDLNLNCCFFWFCILFSVCSIDCQEDSTVLRSINQHICNQKLFHDQKPHHASFPFQSFTQQYLSLLTILHALCVALQLYDSLIKGMKGVWRFGVSLQLTFMKLMRKKRSVGPGFTFLCT